MPLCEIRQNEAIIISPTSFTNEGLKEREIQDILKDNISIIDENLCIIREEFKEWSQGDRRIDLLAIDKEANLVVIELKRTEDGGHMELQALRYAAMVANMTWVQAVATYEKYLLKNNKEGNAQELLCQFLEWDTPQEDQFGQEVKIILVSSGFSPEITTSVLWLNEKDLDIRCIRFTPYNLDGRILLDVEQIIPLPEAKDYQVAVEQKKREEKTAKQGNTRDYSEYILSYQDERYGYYDKKGEYQERFIKAHIGYHTVKLLEERGMIDDEVFQFLRNDFSAGNIFRLLSTKEEIMLLGNKDYIKKYPQFDKKPEFLYKNQEYFVARNWGIKNVPRLINKFEERFQGLKYLSSDDS